MRREKEQRQSHFRGDQWFQRKVDERTRAALKRREQVFAEEYRTAGRERLLEYVRGEAKRLGFSPDMGEIIGGNFIAFRLQSCWPQVIRAAGLAPNSRQPKLTRRQIYREEFARQAELFHQERAALKEQKRQANRERADLEAKGQYQGLEDSPFAR